MREELNNLIKRAKKGDVSILENPLCGRLDEILPYAPIHYLAHKGKIEILNYPHLYVIPTRTDKYTSLHILGMRGHLEILEKKESYLITDYEGRTPYLSLALGGNISLLKTGIIESQVDLKGWTAMHYLAAYSPLVDDTIFYKQKNDKDPVLHALVDHPDLTKYTDNMGDTPLHILCRKHITGDMIGNIEIWKDIVQKLLSRKDILVKNNSGIPALQCLATHDQVYAISKEKILNRFNWFDPTDYFEDGEKFGIVKLINTIANVPNTANYIFELQLE